MAGYANGGVPPGIHPGIGGAAAGTVDAGADDDVDVRPRLGGDAGEVGVVVTPAPPSAGAELDEEVVLDVVLVSVLLVAGGDG